MMQMRRQRLAATGFTLLWLSILTIFSFGSNFANALVIHSLLALLVSVKACYLLRRDDGRSAAGVLTYAAALNFGITGGTLIGAITAAGQGAESKTVISRSKLVSRFAGGAIAGCLSGFLYTASNSALQPSNPALQAAAMLVPAVACFLVLTVTEMLTTRLLTRNSLRDRFVVSAPSVLEFAVGIAIAITVRILYALFSWDAMLLVLPIVYLAKQSYVELLSDERSRGKPSSSKLAEIYLSTLQSIVAAIDAKDRFAKSHTSNVERIASAIARQMDLPPFEIEGIRIAAMLHDVGKLGVPEHVLLKHGKFNADEFATIQNHAVMGAKILESVNFPWPICDMIRSHHERWDGTGYPDGLKEDSIPLGARILAVADVYDAMTSKRSYRPSYTPEQAIAHLKKYAGSHFDPQVVQVLERCIQKGDLPGFEHQGALAGKPSPGLLAETPPEPEETHQPSVGADISLATHEFLAMFEIAQTASTSLNLEEVLNLIANKIRNMVSCSTCVIFLKDEDRKKLVSRIAVGTNAKYFDGGRTLVGEGLTGMVAETGEGIVAPYDRNDVMLKQLFDQWVELRTVMVVPITYATDIIGTINLYDTKDNAFSDEDFRILSTVAPQIGKAIQNALLFERTKESALTDPLTGLHNARYLFMHLEQELSRARRSLKTVSVLGLDLDNFKTINDTYGHQQGDIVLQDIARIFLSQVRDYDLVCRCAGDEFIIVLPETERHEALETAQRIKAAIDEYVPELPHDSQIRIGVSIGVAVYPEDGQDARTLIARADEEMYLDKRQRKSGRAA